jgi:hypothetical protein
MSTADPSPISSPGGRSISVGGNVTGGIILTGDHNTASLTYTQPPPADSVDVAAEVAALRALMEKLAAPESRKLGRALDDASEEATRPEPDKAELAGALERAVKASKGASDFVQNATEITERVVRLAGWIGPLANGALALLGLTV